MSEKVEKLKKVWENVCETGELPLEPGDIVDWKEGLRELDIPGPFLVVEQGMAYTTVGYINGQGQMSTFSVNTYRLRKIV